MRRLLAEFLRRFLLPLITLVALGTGGMYLGFWMGKGRPLPILQPQRLRVAVVNVGAGEASWIRTPSGRFIVIGGGPRGMGERVARSLRAAGAERIDILLIPHPYPDTVGGLLEVMGAFPVERAIEVGWPTDNGLLEEARRFLRAERIPVRLARAGYSFTVDGVRVDMLAPAEPLMPRGQFGANNSLVFTVRWGDTRFLWTGALSKAGEDALIARMPDLRADWLRVARSPDSSATSSEFLRLVSPEFAVISAAAPAQDNRLSPGALERLAATGSTVYRTDMPPGAGDTLLFYSDGVRITHDP